MTDKEINQGNKLIAEFMGLEIITDGISFFDTSYKALKKYNSSLDCLIPVIDKIEAEGYDTGICGVTINGQKFSEVIISPIKKGDNIEIHMRYSAPKVELMWSAIVQFINFKKQLKPWATIKR